MTKPSPLRAISACRSIRRLPDGTVMNSTSKHALLVLATYWPNVWPSQARLAADMGVSRSQVIRRLRVLVDAGLVSQTRRWNSSNVYALDIEAIYQLGSADGQAGGEIGF